LELPKSALTQLGLYSINDYSIGVKGTQIYLVTTVSKEYINIALNGFAYKPSMERRLNGRIGRSFVHLWGDWYTFEEIEKF
jgi:hypothetical protein